MLITMIILCNLTTFGVGVLSSVIGAIIVVFLLFFLLRPRMKVNDKIAIDSNKKLIFCFKNRSISPCINVHVLIKQVKELGNADESEYNFELEDDDAPYMSGCLSKENDNELGVITRHEVSEIPAHLRMIISAQHAISGITSVTTKDFFAQNAQEGTFEKGLFIPKGSDYARVYTRQHLRLKKIVSWISGSLIVLLTALYGVLFAETWQQVALSFILLTCFTGIIILFWQSHVQARANAFSSRGLSKSIHLMMIAFGKKFPGFRGDVEEVEEVKENDRPRRERVRKH